MKSTTQSSSFLVLLVSFISLTTALSLPLHLLDAPNFSVVGTNATYRAAYLAASPQGSDPARAPLDQAMLKLPGLQFNATLNRECGNLTTVAFDGAESNFTSGIVLQFKVNAAASAKAGATCVAVVAAMLALIIGGLL